MTDTRTEELLRTLAPQVLGALVRRYGHFDTAEDAVQEALVAATAQWPETGVPHDPKAWLIAVAARRLIDLLRTEQARRRREDAVAQALPSDQWAFPAVEDRVADADDTLILLFLCCHPALAPASQIALTLRAVGGLTTAEIARAFLVPVDTMTRRISRAKRTIKSAGTPFRMPLPQERDARLAAVLHVLYLIFTEGYAATAGPDLYRTDLSAEAIRLARIMYRLLDQDDEVAGLLALMLLTDARRPARAGPHGELIPMAEQDRSHWDRSLITEGIALITLALPRGDPPGPYQLQAAIAAVHDEAATAEDTDWPQIAALYTALHALTDNPVVALNRAVAVGMSSGAEAGLAMLAELETDGRLGADHRFYAVRAHLRELSGADSDAISDYRHAAQLTGTVPQQRYLNSRADRLAAR
ncbi:RNA polymerase sigma factor [Nocardia sp. NBC_01388]|uniref:RNA polymerase sigma factor n=1 Tax=Nocardia sp. NBC_01388 TaxID=2903596 RepID=UPI00324DCD00